MTSYNHTPIANDGSAPGNAETVNSPLGALDAAIGNRTTLTTTAKASAVAAINEVDANADAASASIGSLASLDTTEKANLVAAINEVFGKVWLQSGGADPAIAALRAWTAGESYELLSITYEPACPQVIKSATVLWPDGSTGTYTATKINIALETVDAFTISHILSGTLITQLEVTRNGDGLITIKPALTFSANQPLLDKLAIYWTMNEYSDGTAGAWRYDKVGNYRLTDGNTVPSAVGVSGNCASMSEATNERLYRTGGAELPIGSQSFMIDGFWNLVSKTADRNLLSKWDIATNQRSYRLIYSDSAKRFEFSVSANGVAVSTVYADVIGEPSINQWYYVAAWYDDDAGQIYIQVDDNAPNNSPHAGGIHAGTADLLIATNLKVDEVALWVGYYLNEGERLARYNGAVYPFGHIIRQRLEDCTASWWSQPRAVYLASQDKTYVGGVSASGRVTIATYNHATKTEDRRILHVFPADEHCTPCMLVPSDAVPVVFYAGHRNNNFVYYRKGTVIGDITSLGAEQAIDFGSLTTYTQIFRQTGTNNLLLLARAGATDIWLYSVSTDYGDTWSAPAVLFDLTEAGYFGGVQVGNVVRGVLYGHPSSASDHNVYYCEIDLVSGDITSPGLGTIDNFKTPASLPINVRAELFMAYANPVGHGTRLLDISAAPSPEICLIDWTNDNDAVYKYLKWNGATFDIQSITAAGVVIGDLPASHYHAGAIFPNPTTGGIVYVARELSGAWIVERWTTVDNGATWSRELVDSSTTEKLFRPYSPIGDPDKVLYNRGTYTDYSNYYTNMMVGDL